MMRRGHPIFTNGLIIALVLGTAACGDTVGPDADADPDPRLMQIAFAHVTVENGTDVVTAAIPGGDEATLTLTSISNAATITVEWLDSAGEIISGLTTANLELRITGRTFTATPGTFSGTISGLMAWSNPVRVLAWDPLQSRDVFGVGLSLVRAPGPDPNPCEDRPPGADMSDCW